MLGSRVLYRIAYRALGFSFKILSGKYLLPVDPARTGNP